MFHQGFQTPRNNNSTVGLRPRALICFSVFETPDETLALVFDILLQQLIISEETKKEQFHSIKVKCRHHRSTIILIVQRYKELFLKHVVVFPLLETTVCYDVCHNILRLCTFVTSNNTLCPTNKLNKLDFGNNLC